MKTSAIRSKLAALRRDHTKKPLIRQVEAFLPDIEAAIADGIGYAAICDVLQAADVPISPNTLKRCLYRLRMEQAAVGSEDSTR